MSKHTSGPWETNGVSVFDPIGLHIADSKYPGFQRQGNAHLIAAAPELLEACKYAERIIEVARKYFPKSIHNSDTFSLENACATIGKAIRKAEGK